eukprot:GHVU01042197.1.p1 GENE.GHVU01042197.1~~GHVU01042197.1.p1  ORF type:complete len:134 (+),score=6.22 GHVU01042197.1:381-782(+)
MWTSYAAAQRTQVSAVHATRHVYDVGWSRPHSSAEAMIVTYVRGCICSGVGISLEQLVNGIVTCGTVVNSILPRDFLDHYVSATAAVTPDSFRKWLARALDRHDLVQGLATISQNIPEAGFDIAINSSAALRA